MMRRRATLCLLHIALLLGVASSGCSRELPASHPETPRLVVLSPAIAIMLRDAGIEGMIVGRHGYDLVLPPSLPVCGDQAGLDYEAIVRARPTHVLLEWGERELPRRLGDLSQRVPFEVINLELSTLEQIADAADSLQDRLSPSHAGRGIGTALLETIAGLHADRREVGTVLLLGSCSPPSALGPGSFHGEILSRLGASPAITSGARWIEMDAEDVLRLAPDAIILIEPRTARTAEPLEPTWDDLMSRLGVISGLDIPAVSNRRVALIDDPLAFAPSTSLGDIARSMARILDRWAAE